MVDNTKGVVQEVELVAKPAQRISPVLERDRWRWPGAIRWARHRLPRHLITKRKP